MREVRQERTGWRDEALSERHRIWGYDLPAVDLDFILDEYDSGDPYGLVEYKNEHAAPQDYSHPSYLALIRLGTRARLPVFCARYKDDFSEWIVTPLNEYAEVFLPKEITMNEREWVTLLYQLRGRNTPPEILCKLHG